MRVLMTTDTVGGVWNYSKELTEGMLRRGCSLTLMSMGRAPSREQAGWARGMLADWPGRFRYVPTEFKLEWMQDGADCLERSRDYVVSCARAFGADVLHSNQFCYGALEVDCAKVVVGHSDVLSWWAACRGGSPERSRWIEAYERTVAAGLQGADAVVAPSHWMAEQLRKHYRFGSVVRVIANGRAAVEAASDAEDHGPPRVQAITCGRLWDESKNLRLLGEVDAAIPILVAGETEFEVGCEVPASVELLGPLSDRELQARFRQSSVYLVTSRYEPFGLAAVEAALAGCAVVANDIPSLREVWGDAAVYFEYNSATSLSGVLRALSGDPRLLRAMAHAAEVRARESYSAERMTDEYLALYRELQAGRARRHVA